MREPPAGKRPGRRTITPPEELVLSPPSRHRAPGIATRLAQRIGVSRRPQQAPGSRRTVLGLSLACALLLVAAPLALLLSGGGLPGGSGGGSGNDSDGVYTGGPDSDTGAGPTGGGGAVLTTQASRTPAPGEVGAAGGVDAAGDPVLVDAGTGA